MFAGCLPVPPKASRCLPLPPVVSPCLPSRFSFILRSLHNLLVVSCCLPLPPVLMRLVCAVSLPFARCLPLSPGAFRFLPLYPVVSRCLPLSPVAARCLPLPPVVSRCPPLSPIASRCRPLAPSASRCFRVISCCLVLPIEVWAPMPLFKCICRFTSRQSLAAGCLRSTACHPQVTPCNALTAKDLRPTTCYLPSPTSDSKCRNEKTISFDRRILIDITELAQRLHVRP